MTISLSCDSNIIYLYLHIFILVINIHKISLQPYEHKKKMV